MATRFIKKVFLYGAGHTYSNLSRLFIRLFVGIMFMQFGIRQIGYFDELVRSFHGVMGMTPELTLILMIAIELVCSALIMVGLFTRISVILPIITMIFAEKMILQYFVQVDLMRLYSIQAGYLPIMFIGIFFFILLAGQERFP